jgi:hypothetical protein
MEATLGEALGEFNAALDRFRAGLPKDTSLTEAIFGDAEDWLDLLAYKLVPHLAGEGCLVVAVAGGTNTGKSTVFNLLLGSEVSPVVTTAAATRHPVMAGSRLRAGQCLEAKLVPEFDARLLKNPRAVLTDDLPEDALYVAEVTSLPDRLVLMDTPDVDSIDKQNWEVAENIRAAGDVLIAVLTGEKYKDERVVEFFRKARLSGRVVLPLMNKANPADGYAVARVQLTEFGADVGLQETPCFVVPHDFGLSPDHARAIAAVDGGPDLWTYLTSRNVPAIKQQVYRDTVAHFAERAGVFLRHCEDLRAGLRSVADEYKERAEALARRYDPVPGTAIGGLFHAFVQEKRGPVRRAIGAASAAVARGLGTVGRTLAGAMRRRTAFEAPGAGNLEEDIRAVHVRALNQIARELAAGYIESGRNLREPAGHLVQAGLDELDVDAAVAVVIQQTLRAESVSEAFRRHAHRTIEAWWNDHTGKRRALEILDALLAVAPTAIAAPIGMYTAGFGVAEAVALTGPIVEQFLARVVEYQFGDQMFDLLSPWKEEQQAHLKEALLDHLTNGCLAKLRAALDLFEGEVMIELKRRHEECLKAL